MHLTAKLDLQIIPLGYKETKMNSMLISAEKTTIFRLVQVVVKAVADNDEDEAELFHISVRISPNKVTSSESSEWSTAMKVGVAVGAVCAVILLAVVLTCCCCKYYKRNRPPMTESKWELA